MTDRNKEDVRLDIVLLRKILPGTIDTDLKALKTRKVRRLETLALPAKVAYL